MMQMSQIVYWLGIRQEKHKYEDDAEESDMDSFIDDEEPDESDSEAQQMVFKTAKSLRNRRSWRTHEVTACALCNDMRIVLGHLLGIDQ